ncbi:MAG: hypothetical protein ACLRWQ_03505 [Flavonifractor plautii]
MIEEPSPTRASAPSLSGTYTVTKEFDRMGCRLEGEVIAHRERRRHHLGRHRLRRHPGPVRWSAHHHAGRPADHRRIWARRSP